MKPTKSKLATISVVLAGLAGLVVLICIVWILLLDPKDWGALVPFYGIVFVGHPLAGLAIVTSVIGTSLRHERPAIALIVVNVVMIAGPWIWFGMVT